MTCMLYFLTMLRTSTFSSRDDESSESGQSKVNIDVEFPLGTKLKVKYGKGKNHKVYEAKVVDVEDNNGSVNYLVHYNGWNTR